MKNSAGIRDAEQLERFETIMVMARSAEPLPNGGSDPAHYRAIHRHLFQDVYNWAGAYRTVRTAKGGDMFCYPEHIADQMELLFARLGTDVFLPREERSSFIMASADFLSELNAIHPFREGNGRTQLTFLFLLGERAGHRFDMTRIRPAEMLAAMIESFHGRLASLCHELDWICPQALAGDQDSGA